MTLRRFIREHGITSTVEYADRNPDMPDDDWSRSASHYRVTLRRGRRRMTVYFSMGSAHTDEPDIEDVLDLIASDAAGYENAGGAESAFDSWCSEYGYDTDSRKAERTFRAIAREAGSLLRFLDRDGYDALLWNTDRL